MVAGAAPSGAAFLILSGTGAVKAGTDAPLAVPVSPRCPNAIGEVRSSRFDV
jgi:hypothetical protein